MFRGGCEVWWIGGLRAVVMFTLIYSNRRTMKYGFPVSIFRSRKGVGATFRTPRAAQEASKQYHIIEKNRNEKRKAINHTLA